MKKEYKFKIGDFVSFPAIHVPARRYVGEETERFFQRKLHKQGQGQITGLSRRYTGYVAIDRGDDYNYSRLVVKGFALFWCVREGLLNKELLVAEEDLTLLSYFMSHPIPSLKVKQYPWSAAHREQMSEWSKDFPRDSKGRFTKPTYGKSPEPKKEQFSEPEKEVLP